MRVKLLQTFGVATGRCIQLLLRCRDDYKSTTEELSLMGVARFLQEV